MIDVPRLHLIGPLHIVPPEDYVEIARQAASGGCDGIHLRVHELRGGDLLQLAIALNRELDAFARVKLIINDRVDVAQLADADGLQLGERSFETGQARTIVSDRMLIGRSVHDLDGALRAEAAGASYLLAGHVYDTPSKAGQPGRGLAWLEEITRAVTIPAIAIGGITQERVPEVLEAGAYGVAMGRELLACQDPAAVSASVLQCIERYGGNDE